MQYDISQQYPPGHFHAVPGTAQEMRCSMAITRRCIIMMNEIYATHKGGSSLVKTDCATVVTVVSHRTKRGDYCAVHVNLVIFDSMFTQSIPSHIRAWCHWVHKMHAVNYLVPLGTHLYCIMRWGG